MRHFYQILGNTLISNVTNTTVWFALIFFVYLQTQAVAATSLMSGIYLGAVALTGFWFGSLIDHNKKKTVMLLSSLGSLAIYILSLTLYLTADPEAFSRFNSVTLWIFIPLVLLGVIIGNIRSIALPTVITLLVPEKNRDKANGMAGTVNGVGFLITSVISGFLVGHSGMLGVLILAIVMSILSALHLLTVPMEEKKIIDGGHADAPKKLDIKGTWKAIVSVPGLAALIFFTMFNNFLGGVFMALMDAYGLSLVSVQVWGVLWGGLSCAFIIGGALIAKFGLGKNPVRTMFMANLIIWAVSCVFTAYPSIILLSVGMFVYLCVAPFIQASEFTIIQKVVPSERQGRVFGFAQSVEQAASPLTAFAIGPITQFFFIPFMTTGKGVEWIGSWFGTGSSRGIALVFTLAGIIGLCATLLAIRSKYYRILSERYLAKEGK